MRYADYFVILCGSRRAGERILRSVRKYLARHWRMSHNSLVKRAMNNQWLAEQGVPSLENQWVSIRYPDGPKKSKSPG